MEAFKSLMKGEDQSNKCNVQGSHSKSEKKKKNSAESDSVSNSSNSKDVKLKKIEVISTFNH